MRGLDRTDHFWSQVTLSTAKLIDNRMSPQRFHGRHGMKLHLSLITVAALLIAADTAKDEAANKKDRDKLQGNWSLVRGEQDGRQVALDQVKFYRLSIAGDKYTFKTK